MARVGGRGWGTVAALALAAAVLSVFDAVVLIFLPLALLWVALPPRRPLLLAAAATILAWSFAQRGTDSFWYAERGWALILGAWFVLMVLLLPRGGFLARALAAIGAATASSALLFLVDRRAWASLDWLVAHRLRDGAADAVAVFGPVLGTASWGARLTGAVYQAAELQALLYPALLALGSLAGLGVAWWAYRRLSLREAHPLAPIREFRFRDELVWLVIAGAVLIALPLGELATRAGSNVLAFMSVLYALRGTAVILALTGAIGPGGVFFAAVSVLLLYPLVMAAAVLVGLTDTWFDLRARRRANAGARGQGPGVS
ncbi:MAG: DUF2232 domain-containing protein [Gemmatimonadetes bacterium]|nr:DUF2232 domain-containing protein [Gemmatimonadota bacterium]